MWLLRDQGCLRWIPFCWAWCQERATLLSWGRTLMSLWGGEKGTGKDLEQGNDSGTWSAQVHVPRHYLERALVLAVCPSFSSFISTEEWLELHDLFHQHLSLKLNCRVLVKNKLKPFRKTHSAVLMSIFSQGGEEREIHWSRMCIWKENKSVHELQVIQDLKINKLCSKELKLWWEV